MDAIAPKSWGRDIAVGERLDARQIDGAGDDAKSIAGNVVVARRAVGGAWGDGQERRALAVCTRQASALDPAPFVLRSLDVELGGETIVETRGTCAARVAGPAIIVM